MWADMASTSMPFRITLFETESYYADKNGACRLFRGHPVMESPENMVAPLKAAEDLALCVADKLEKNGRVDNDIFFEWA